jgi:ribosomal protein S27E
MSASSAKKDVKTLVPGTDQASIDQLYGLDPVFEAGSDPRMVPLSVFHKIRCPHCHERIEVNVETVYGSQRYVEDCQVCCGPIEMVVTVEAGELESIKALKPER